MGLLPWVPSVRWACVSPASHQSIQMTPKASCVHAYRAFRASQGSSLSLQNHGACTTLGVGKFTSPSAWKEHAVPSSPQSCSIARWLFPAFRKQRFLRFCPPALLPPPETQSCGRSSLFLLHFPPALQMQAIISVFEHIPFMMRLKHFIHRENDIEGYVTYSRSHISSVKKMDKNENMLV